MLVLRTTSMKLHSYRHTSGIKQPGKPREMKCCKAKLTGKISRQAILALLEESIQDHMIQRSFQSLDLSSRLFLCDSSNRVWRVELGRLLDRRHVQRPRSISSPLRKYSVCQRESGMGKEAQIKPGEEQERSRWLCSLAPQLALSYAGCCTESPGCGVIVDCQPRMESNSRRLGE